MEKWVPLVKDMTWGDVKAHFEKEWAKQWELNDDETVVDLLGPYEARIKATDTSVMSKYTPGTTTSSRKPAAKNDPSVIVLKVGAKKAPRNDSGKARKYQDQEKFAVMTVEQRWDQGDPIGKQELYLEMSVRDDCAEGTVFYDMFLNPEKGKTAASALSNWMKRVLNRCGWSPRKKTALDRSCRRIGVPCPRRTPKLFAKLLPQPVLTSLSMRIRRSYTSTLRRNM